MAKVLKQSSFKYSSKYQYYPFIWYQYHRLFFRSLIFKGNKLWAFKFLCDLKFELKMHEGIEPFWIFLVALMKIAPEVLLFPKKRGGGLQWVPLPISEKKQYTFAIKWVIKLLKDKFRVVKISTVVDVLVGAVYGKGLAIEKKDSIHAVADLNRHLVRFFR